MADKKISAGDVRKKWEDGSKATRKESHEYWLNSHFLGGEQWVFLHKESGMIEEYPRLDPDRVRVTMNRLGANTRTVISRLLGRELVFEVDPVQVDDAAVHGAMTAEAILEDYKREHDWENKREDHALSCWKGGTAALCLDWDPKAGPELGPHPDHPKQTVYGGDIVESVLAITEFTVEAGTRDAERAPWWIKAAVMPPKQAQEQFDLEHEPKPDATTMLSPLQSKLIDNNQEGSSFKLTLVLTYYERPCKKNPDGVVAIVIGKEVVASSKWPFPFKDRLNLAVARETHVHERWTGDTILSNARSPQVGYNQSWSSIIEHMKLCGNARTWVPDVTMDQLEELTDTPGEFVPFNSAGGPPVVISPPQMPQWWIQQPQILRAEIDDLTAIEEVIRGEAPRNVESGLGLSILSENAQSPIGHLSDELAGAWSRFATMVLQTLRVKVKPPDKRNARIVEEPGELPQMFQWSGEDFKNQTIAKVPKDAVAPRSRAQQIAWGQSLLDRGAIDLRTFARIVNVPGQDKFMASADPDTARAHRENVRMSQGDPAIPQRWDDHAKHIMELNRFRKSDRYEYLPDEIKKLFDLHAAAHAQLAGEEAAEQESHAMLGPEMEGVATPDEIKGSGTGPPPPEGTAEAQGQGPKPPQQPGQPGRPPGGTPPGGGQTQPARQGAPPGSPPGVKTAPPARPEQAAKNRAY